MVFTEIDPQQIEKIANCHPQKTILLAKFCLYCEFSSAEQFIHSDKFFLSTL